MKKMIWAFILFAFACGSGSEDSLAGVYVRSNPDKNGILFDTVKIAVLNPAAHQFVVEQTLHYRRKGGQQTLKDYSREKYAGYYNTSKNVLEIPEVMGFLSFDSDGMLFGPSRYQKIQ